MIQSIQRKLRFGRKQRPAPTHHALQYPPPRAESVSLLGKAPTGDMAPTTAPASPLQPPQESAEMLQVRPHSPRTGRMKTHMLLLHVPDSLAFDADQPPPPRFPLSQTARTNEMYGSREIVYG